MSERTKDFLYMVHAFVVWVGGSHQIFTVFSHRSAQDISLVWIACLLISELTALPRCFGSEFWVWKACHVVSSVLIAILLTGVVMYK